MNPFEEERHIEHYLDQVKDRSDRLVNFFLGCYFLIGLLLAFFYDTWLIAMGVGGLSLIGYYSAKYALPKSNFYQYVLSVVMGIFMAQYIYQMHGMFEMHFFAFVGSAILITYQDWKLQIPLALVVVVHHALFGYLQYLGYTGAYETKGVYFTQLDFMDLQTFIIHGILATVIFGICGLWAHNFRVSSRKHIQQSFEIGRLQEADSQKDALEQQNRELVKTNAELDRFVYSASHELRSPLTSVMGLISIARMNEKDKGQLKLMDMMQTSVERLDIFIQDIVNYSGNSRMDLAEEKIDFEAVIAECIEQLRYMPEVENVSIFTEVLGDCEFLSDRKRISVIINNLLSNALKYQKPDEDKPYIHVIVNVSPEVALITISDNGSGIPREYQDKIFNMFYRATERKPGTGLGLYIVKEIVDRLEGKVHVESEPGKGSTFYVSIPSVKAS
jgi:signal transduction histidine kinase